MNRFITEDVARRRLFLLGLLIAAGAAQAKEKAMVVPGCAQQSPQQCVTAALEAMGGRERLQQVSSVRMQTVEPYLAGGTVVSSGAIHHIL